VLRFRRCSVYERSAVSLRIPNILRITVRYSASHISAGHAYTRILAAALLVANVTNQRRELDNEYGIPSSCSVPLLERCRFHDFTPQFTIICSVPGRPQPRILLFKIILDGAQPGLSRTQAYVNPRKIYINLEKLRTTANIRIHLILPESRVIGLRLRR